jgi:PsbN protein
VTTAGRQTRPAPVPASPHAPGIGPTLPPLDPSSSGFFAFLVALVVLAVLLGLTGFGIYIAFGPPSKQLSDPFDDHDD